MGTVEEERRQTEVHFKLVPAHSGEVVSHFSAFAVHNGVLVGQGL